MLGKEMLLTQASRAKSENLLSETGAAPDARVPTISRTGMPSSLAALTSSPLLSHRATLKANTQTGCTPRTDQPRALTAREVGGDGAILGAVRKALEAAESRICGHLAKELSRAQVHGDRLREAACTRLDARLGASEAWQLRCGRQLADLGGRCSSISEEMQVQIRRVDQLDEQLFTWRQRVDHDLQARIEDVEQRHVQLAATLQTSKAGYEEAQRGLMMRIAQLEQVLSEQAAQGRDVNNCVMNLHTRLLHCEEHAPRGGQLAASLPAPDSSENCFLEIVEKQCNDLKLQMSLLQEETSELRTMLEMQGEAHKLFRTRLESKEEHFKTRNEQSAGERWDSSVKLLAMRLQRLETNTVQQAADIEILQSKVGLQSLDYSHCVTCSSSAQALWGASNSESISMIDKEMGGCRLQQPLVANGEVQQAKEDHWLCSAMRLPSLDSFLEPQAAMAQPDAVDAAASPLKTKWFNMAEDDGGVVEDASDSIMEGMLTNEVGSQSPASATEHMSLTTDEDPPNMQVSSQNPADNALATEYVSLTPEKEPPKTQVGNENSEDDALVTEYVSLTPQEEPPKTQVGSQTPAETGCLLLSPREELPKMQVGSQSLADNAPATEYVPPTQEEELPKTQVGSQTPAETGCLLLSPREEPPKMQAGCQSHADHALATGYVSLTPEEEPPKTQVGSQTPSENGYLLLSPREEPPRMEVGSQSPADNVSTTEYVSLTPKEEPPKTQVGSQSPADNRLATEYVSLTPEKEPPKTQAGSQSPANNALATEYVPLTPEKKPPKTQVGSQTLADNVLATEHVSLTPEQEPPKTQAGSKNSVDSALATEYASWTPEEELPKTQAGSQLPADHASATGYVYLTPKKEMQVGNQSPADDASATEQVQSQSPANDASAIEHMSFSPEEEPPKIQVRSQSPANDVSAIEHMSLTPEEEPPELQAGSFDSADKVEGMTKDFLVIPETELPEAKSVPKLVWANAHAPKQAIVSRKGGSCDIVVSAEESDVSKLSPRRLLWSSRSMPAFSPRTPRSPGGGPLLDLDAALSCGEMHPCASDNFRKALCDEDCVTKACRRKERAILSVRLGSPRSGPEFAMAMQRDSFVGQFYTYNPNIWCTQSCDPDFASLDHPCRGTSSTCRMPHGMNCSADGRPRVGSCWRFACRFHQQECKDSGGFLVQFEELSGLDDRQRLETLIAKEVGLKVFRLKIHTERIYPYMLSHSLRGAVREWYDCNCNDMSMETIRY